MPRGIFITFEGGEGTGKTTQIRLLENYLHALGHDVLVSREPGGTPFAEAVRGVLLDPRHTPDGLSEYFLLAACRRNHVRTLLRPALESGKIVLCDRFSDSSVVYQGIVRGIGIDVVENIDRLATDGLTPDLTFVIDLDPVDALPRVHARNATTDTKENRLDDEPETFHRQVRAGFLQLAKIHRQRIRMIDGNAERDEVHLSIVKALPKELGKKCRFR